MYITVGIKPAGNSCTSNLLHNATSGTRAAALQNSTSTFGPSQENFQKCMQVAADGCGPICSSWRGLKEIQQNCVKEIWYSLLVELKRLKCVVHNKARC
uniref:Uncharacterized protein n=1 Tax=Arundo donax TaxID=35708 RepID=A0A0A9DJG2_ARUDO